MRPHTLLRLVALTLAISATDQRIKAQEVPVATASSVDGDAQDLFAAVRSGALDVRLIPKNDRESRVLLRNNTKLPLTVRLPAAFAGVPVLAQAAGGKGRGGAAAGGNQNQGVGGGFGGGGGGLGGGGLGGGGGAGGGGGGFFSVPPEKVAQLRVPIVCLEHGKKDPRPSVPYEIRPLESLTSKPGVRELLVQLATGEVGQRSAQAAAWHLANDMSWETLSGKQIEHINAPSEAYFTPDEIAGAIESAQTAQRQADAAKTALTPGALPSANR